MNVYARLQEINSLDTVVEIIVPPTIDDAQVPIDEMFTPEFVAALVDVTSADPRPAQWWTASETNGVWTFEPPVAAS
jgi:hypothetical protein